MPNHVTDERVEQHEHLRGDVAVARTRKLLPNFRTAMFVTGASAGRELHVRPLALQGDLSVFGGTLWFFVDERSSSALELGAGTAVTLLFQNDADNCYLQLDGTASLVKDTAKMRELYTPGLKAWFPEGLDDPHLTLVRFDAARGAFWENPGGPLQAISAIASAVVTGKPGRSGRAGTLSFR